MLTLIFRFITGLRFTVCGDESIVGAVITLDIDLLPYA